MTIAAHPDSKRGRASRGLPGASLTSREEQLLAATLQVLSETGYDKLTVDQVVARAHASKTTVYRRWPSKADLVGAAFAHRTRGEFGAPPDTGTLRGDLLALADMIAAGAVRERGADQFGLRRPAPVHRRLAGVSPRHHLVDGELVVPGLAQHLQRDRQQLRLP